MQLTLSDFHYHLPPKLIAQEPIRPRDSARLMLINRQTGEISHHHVFDLPHLIPQSSHLIANNTKVFPARLIGHKPTGGKVEILLIQPLGQSRYKCIARPSLKVGDVIEMRTVLTGTITHSTGYERTIKFDTEESRLRTLISQIGAMPTPPYIKKLLGNSLDYQTIYAKYGFSAAAPTAGLHFTPDLLRSIKTQSKWHELTLNVGLGTFLPVKENDIANHHMHNESYTISPHLASAINKQRSDLCLSKLLAIGTTTMRALESNVTLSPSSEPCDSECSQLLQPTLRPGSYSTNIFIYPPYKFQVVDALMTNFHLPGSTLLMLVSAFCSAPNSSEKFTNFKDSLLGRAYALAISHKYRFFSFGDAMLII